MIISKNIQMQSHLNMGFHGPENFCTDEGRDETYFSISIVDSLNNGEFEFNFCSIQCMRDWFNIIFDDLQDQLS